MFEAMFTAASGVMSQQKRVDTIADNFANINTAAFKASRLNFKDMLYVDGRYAYRDQAENQQKGHGVAPTSVSRNFATGSLQSTERELDFAIEGEGFFTVATPDGGIRYTRPGNFYLSEVEGQKYLVNSHGNFVLDEAGAPIVLPPGATSLSVNTEGYITFTNPSGLMQAGGRIGIFAFTNPDGLSAQGSAYYVPTVASGEARPAEKFRLRQNTLEMSNVEAGQEMTRLIRAQRAFSLASRALTTADEMEGIANNMRR